jgi:predicted HAD superfamily Cof-like phosphohydrolase
MSNNFDDVGAFHEKFGLHNTTWHPEGPHVMSTELEEFRLKFLDEELQELRDGLAEEDEAKTFDALLDLVYVAMGTAHLRGYPWQAGWDAVQAANMSKERALSNEDTRSKRGSSYDVVKPDGWTAPDIEGVLSRYGW